MKSLIIIPTYNEIENIEEIIQAILSTASIVDILVVDDNSPDGTAQKVEQLMTEIPHRIYLLKRSVKNGLGQAYIAGFQWAVERGYFAVIQMDADFSHDPKEIPNMIRALEQNHMVIGSRYIKGVNVVNWPIGRILLSYGASIYVRWITGMPIKDPTAGFNAIRMDILKQLNFSEIRFVGYAFQIEMKYWAWRSGFHLKEIPIVFTNREKGVSKMHGNIIWEALYGVLYLRLLKNHKHA